MKKNNLAKYITIIFIFAAGLSYAQNVSKVGTTAASFLEIPAGASAIGMGGAYVSVADGVSSLYWNPGGIASSEKYEVVINHSEWIAETNYDYAGLVLPLGSFGNLGFSFTSLNMDDMKVRTVEMPEGTGEYFSAEDIAIGVSYARFLTDRFSIGFTAKYVQQTIWHMSASAFAMDIGTIFRTDLFGGMNIGASISNFGSAMKLEGRDARYFIQVDNTKSGSNDRIPVNVEMDSWELPLVFQLGVSTPIVNTDNYRLVVAVDAVHPTNDYESMNVGGEFSFMNILVLRGGYQSLFLDDSEGGLTLGLGLNSKMLFSDALVKFDYAYRDYGRLKDVHSFSVSLAF